jgi:cyclophilin family peptidyl-prolyl cis-trans isomerase
MNKREQYLNKERALTVAQSVARMREEIEIDVRRGVLPANVSSFSELHEFVDANEYGGFCVDRLADAMIAQYGGRDQNEGMPDGMMKHISDAQNAIDVWIRKTCPAIV